MRTKLVISTIGLLVASLSSAFWMVSAADPTATVRMTVDVALAKDSDFLSGFLPSRTTIAHLFQNHMIHNADTPVLVSSIASAIDVRKLRRAVVASAVLSSRSRNRLFSNKAAG